MRPLVLAKETGERLANTSWVIVLIKSQLSEPVVESVQLLKKAYNKELPHKFVPGFIQFISVDSLTIALWSEKDTRY